MDTLYFVSRALVVNVVVAIVPIWRPCKTRYIKIILKTNQGQGQRTIHNKFFTLGKGIREFVEDSVVKLNKSIFNDGDSECVVSSKNLVVGKERA
jgi:hypothetical protein